MPGYKRKAALNFKGGSARYKRYKARSTRRYRRYTRRPVVNRRTRYTKKRAFKSKQKRYSKRVQRPGSSQYKVIKLEQFADYTIHWGKTSDATNKINPQNMTDMIPKVFSDSTPKIQAVFNDYKYKKTAPD